MGIDVHWWFYKVEEADFEVVQSKFEQAAEEVPSLPEVPALSPRPQAPPVTQDYIDSVLEGIFIGRAFSSELYHEPFQLLAFQILEEEFPLSHENCIDIIIQSRVAPTAVLLMGIGSERFSQLPGYLGNMLIHPSEVEQTIELVFRILDVDWESYFERAKLILEYAEFDAAKMVSDTLQAIPKALEKVKNHGTGLLAITSWGCP